MKNLITIAIIIVVLSVICLITFQITSKEEIKEVQLKECVNCQAGLFSVSVTYNGVTYKGNTNISAGFFTKQLKPESTLTLRKKGLFKEISNYK